MDPNNGVICAISVLTGPCSHLKVSVVGEGEGEIINWLRSVSCFGNVLTECASYKAGVLRQLSLQGNMRFHCSCSADTGYSGLQIHLTSTQLSLSLIRKQTKALPLTSADFQLGCFTALFVLLDQTVI